MCKNKPRRTKTRHNNSMSKFKITKQRHISTLSGYITKENETNDKGNTMQTVITSVGVATNVRLYCLTFPPIKNKTYQNKKSSNDKGHRKS